MTAGVAPPPECGRAEARGALLDFLTLELLIATRLPVGVRAFRRWLLGGLTAGALLLVGAGAAAGTLLTAPPANDGQGNVRAAAAAVVLALLYIGAAAAVTELLGRRRTVVRSSPNAALLRALDVRMSTLFLYTCVLRAVPIAAAPALFVLPATIIAASRGAINPLTALVLTVLPVAIGVAVVSAGAVAAIGRGPIGGGASRTATAFIWVGGGGAALLAGALLAALANPLMPAAPGANSGGSAVDAAAVATILTAVGGALCAVAILPAPILLGRTVRTLRDRPFPLGLSEARAYAQPARRAHAAGTLRHRADRLPLYRVLAGEWRADPGRTSTRRLAAITGAACLAIVGARLGGLDVTRLSIEASWAGGDTASLITRIAIAAGYGITLSAVDASVHRLGPRALAPQLRAAWERGAGASGLLAALTLTHLRAPLLLGVALSAAATAITGRAEPAPVVAAAAVTAATLLAEAAAPRTSNSDSSSSPNAIGVLITTGASLPVIGLLLTATPAGLAAATLLTLALMGGTIACMNRTIRHLAPSARA